MCEVKIINIYKLQNAYKNYKILFTYVQNQIFQIRQKKITSMALYWTKCHCQENTEIIYCDANDVQSVCKSTQA